MSTYVKTLTQDFTLPKTYLSASVFVLLNLIVPQLMHQFSMAGTIFLPILFFTFLAAVRYGTSVGLLTAVASPLVSHLLTGMPPGIVLYIVMAQCMVIALLAGYFANGKNQIKTTQILAVILAYQLVGCLLEFVLAGDILNIWSGFKTTIPGMLIQLGFFTIYGKYIFRTK